MPKPFDATLKQLALEDPAGFLAGLDRPPSDPVQLLNVDLSAVTAAADLVFGLGDPLKEILQVDCQAGPDADKHADVLYYQAALYKVHRVPVHSMILLLWPQARHPNLSGAISYTPRPGRGKMDFGYEVIPLWERPVQELLTGPLNLSPLAVLARVPGGKAGLADVVTRLMDRLDRDAPPGQARRLLTAAYILSGLRVDRPRAFDLFHGVMSMRESTTYVAILEEGEASGMQRVLLRLGREKFGPPDSGVEARIKGIQDRELLEDLSVRLFSANSWSDLLGRTS